MRAVVTLVVPAPAALAFCEALEPFAEAVSTFEAAPGGDWRVEAIGPKLDRAKLAAAVALAAAACGVAEPVLEIRPLPEKDWLKENLRGFRPIAAGRFLIHPSHDRPAAPSKIALCVDAGEAFGTGEHESTRLCLLEIDRIAKRRPRFRGMWALDMGCGSGVLSLAITRRWRVKTLGVDIALEAARITQENARINGSATLVTAVCGDGYRLRAVRRRQYGLIVANILQRSLMVMAPALARHLRRGGRAVLSGFYRDQALAVIAAHRAQGLVLERVTTIGAWCAATFRKA
jgi:ribosomal protein L11 methyltransferase